MFSDVLAASEFGLMLNVEASLWGKHGRYADVEASKEAELLIFTLRRSTQNIQRRSNITVSDINTLFYYYTLGLLEQVLDAQYELKQTNSLIFKC